MRRGTRAVRYIGVVLLVSAASPICAVAQGEVALGVLVVPEPSVGGTQVGPALAAMVFRDVLGVPLFLEVGFARTDFNSLGQDYHHNHYSFALNTEWLPARSGSTRFGFRLGLGAYGEYEIVETDPASSGGDSWTEAVVPGLILERDIGEDRRLVVALTDSVLGPYFAVFDPEEYDVEHRIRLTLGMRF